MSPLTVKWWGDEGKAAEWLSEGKRLLWTLKNRMKLGNLPSLWDGRSYKDGVRIDVSSIYGQDFINIITPPLVVEQKLGVIPAKDLLFLIKDADHYAVFQIGGGGETLTSYNFDISKFITLHGGTLLVAQSPPDADIHHVSIASTPSIYNPTIVNYPFPYPYIPETFNAARPYIWDDGKILAGNLTGDYYPVATGRRHFGLVDGALAWKYRTIVKNGDQYQIAYEIDEEHTIVQGEIRSDGGISYISTSSFSYELIEESGEEIKYWDAPAYHEGSDTQWFLSYLRRHFNFTQGAIAHSEITTPINYLAVLGNSELYTINNINSNIYQSHSDGGKLIVYTGEETTKDFVVSVGSPPVQVVIGHDTLIDPGITLHDDFVYLTTTINVNDTVIIYLGGVEIDRFELNKVNTSQILLNESPIGVTWEGEGFNPKEWYEIHFPPAYTGFGVVNIVCLRKATTWIEGDFVTIVVTYITPTETTTYTFNLLVTNTIKDWNGEVFVSIMDYDYIDDKYVYLCAYYEVDSTQEMKHTSQWGIDISSQSALCTAPPLTPHQPYGEAGVEVSGIKVKDIINDKSTYKYKLVYNIGNGIEEIILDSSYYHQITRNFDERNFKHWEPSEGYVVLDPIPPETTHEIYNGERITGVSCQMSKDFILYTYIVESTNVSATSITWGMDSEGIYHPIGDDLTPLEPEWHFARRIVGNINMETGVRTEHEINDALLGMYEDTFDETLLAAIGLHILEKEVI